MEPAQVAAKRCTTPAEWSFVVNDASMLRLVVENVDSVHHRATFKVSSRKAQNEDQDIRYWLSVDTADIGYTSCVSARLELEKVHFSSDGEESFTFCVDCRHVLVAIDNPASAHGTLTIEGHDSAVHIRIRDPEVASYEDYSVLPTFDEGHEDVELATLEYKMNLEIGVSDLRRAIRQARKAHSDHVRILVYTSDMGARQRSVVVFSVQGDNFYSAQKFCHDTHRDGDGSVTVRATPSSAEGAVEVECFDTEGITPQYDQMFPVDKLDAFAKNIPSRMIVAKIEPKLPLMLVHVLGCDMESQIRLLVAPKHTEID